LLIAAGNIEDAIHSYEMCQTYENCFATIGVHPCRAR
jgi:Tat protein secretion system quality control protein TatD with DNase activity